jgi:arginine decarboxylase
VGPTTAAPATATAHTARGEQSPSPLRFQDILRAQVKRLNEAFVAAIEESKYGNIYRGVYPIKVNQLHEVVDELLDAGKLYGMGLECGSKAELIAALPQIDADTLLICNGVKDRSMLKLMLSGQRLGQNVIPVIERYEEFVELLDLGRELDCQPRLGVRVRLATRGSGRWSESSGMNSKFGLSIVELERMIEVLTESGQLDSLELLHCHIGSQIADIQVLKQATKEVTRSYAELVNRGMGLKLLDLGGGLGVNYDKGHLDEDAGINYSLQEYANAVVFSVQEVCEAQDVPAPVIVTESGRALTAHHSVLIVPVLGANRKDLSTDFIDMPEDAAEPLQGLAGILSYLPGITAVNELLEALHDAHERWD